MVFANKLKLISFRRFDVVLINKLHANMVFDVIESGATLLDFKSPSKFLKTRPGLIIGVFQNNKQQDNKEFIIIPLTTKPIPNQYIHNILREEIKN